MKKPTLTRYLIFIFTVVIIIIANELILQRNLDKQESDAEIINLSGRQRMLGQRIAKHILFMAYEAENENQKYTADSLKKITEQWKTAHHTLYQANIKASESKLLDSLFLISSNQLETIAEASFQVQQSQADSVLQLSLTTVAELERPFLLNMDAIVSEYQRLAELKLAKTKSVVFWLSCLSVVILIAEFIFLIIPFFNNLQEKNNELKKANIQLADFAHITSHNLRAPVSNLNSLLHFYINSESTSDRNTLFEKFETVIHHLTGTLDTLVETLKIKNSNDVKVEEVSLQEIFEKTEEVLSGVIMESSSSIKKDFSKAQNVTFNKVYLESIFLNLIGNSIKYKDESRKPEISIKSERFKDKTRLIFKDNGLGINMERHSKKLFGLNKTFHRHPDAKGIGLYMTKIQIESLGGTISAESEVGKGSSFTVTI